MHLFNAQNMVEHIELSNGMFSHFSERYVSTLNSVRIFL